MKTLRVIWIFVLGLLAVHSQAQVINPYAFRATPNYASLSNVELIVDFTGLAVGTTNSYGIVDGSGNITTLKSLAPGPTGRDFTSNGTAPTLSNGSGVFGGAGVLRHGTAATWNFLHFNATPANMKWTMHIVCKLGTSSDPNAAYGLIGNNGASGGNKGASFFYDDRVAVPRSNAFRGQIAQGGGNFTFNNTLDDVITPNTFQVITIETELIHVSDAYKQRLYINNVLQTEEMVYSSTAMVTTPTFSLDIGSAGNSVLLLTGSIREIIIQSTVEMGTIRYPFVQALISKHAIANTPFDAPPSITQALSIYSTYQETAGKYYLNTPINQHPTKKYLVLGSFLDGVDHTGDATKKISMRRSTNYGLTWGTRADIYDPAGAIQAQGLAAGFTANGRHHMFVNTHAASGANFVAPHSFIYLYSDDEGVTYTTIDLTSILPSDGLATLRTLGTVIQTGNYLAVSAYKFTAEGVFTNSALYCFRIDVNADPSNLSNWIVSTIKPLSSEYVNETELVALNATHVLAMARDEVSGEYEQWISSDNGANWTKQGEQSFGETFSTPGPCTMTKLQIGGTDVIACYYPDRSVPNLKVIYGTVANIIASGTSGFVAGTKTTLINTGRRAHYGSVYHPNGNFDAILYSAYEKNPLDLSDNELITAVLPSTQYATVKTALGL